MTEADTQLLISSATTIVVALLGTITAIWGYRNHQQAIANGQAIAKVQETTDGAAHALASNLADTQTKNEDLIRSLAANAAPPPPP